MDAVHITESKIRHFHQEGYFVLEKVISEADLAALRARCQDLLAEQLDLMKRAGAQTLGLSHRHERHFLACRHPEGSPLERFLFGDLMMEIVKATVGDDAFLFLELFVVKWPRTGSPFAWHQDSGYLLGHPHRPYVSLWCALDDATPSNGALYVLPNDGSVHQAVFEHVKDRNSNDLVGYRGDREGVVVPVPAGSIVVMSSTTLHRSGANTDDDPRRAFLAAYSPEPITGRSGGLWNQAIPFIRNGKKVTPQCALAADGDYSPAG